MSTKKTVRKQRAERGKDRKGRQRRSALTLAVLILLALAVVLVIVLIVGEGPEDDRVWSPAHGHYHPR